MSTTERRVAFLVEDSPGEWSFHVQRGAVNDPGIIDRGLGHLHTEDFAVGNCVFVSTGTIGAIALGTVKLSPGQALARGATGDMFGMSQENLGKIMGWTTGAIFPTPLPTGMHRHWYTGAGQQEWFYWDAVRSKWLSERIITAMFHRSGGITAPNNFYYQDTFSGTDYGMYLNEAYCVIGCQAQCAGTFTGCTVVYRIQGIGVGSWAIGTTDRFWRDSANATLGIGALSVQMTIGSSSAASHIEIFLRRTAS